MVSVVVDLSGAEVSTVEFNDLSDGVISVFNIRLDEVELNLDCEAARRLFDEMREYFSDE